MREERQFHSLIPGSLSGIYLLRDIESRITCTISTVLFLKVFVFFARVVIEFVHVKCTEEVS